MKLETYLNAMVAGVADMYQWASLKQTTKYNIRKRQVNAFRARILRMDAEKDELIIDLFEMNEKLWNQNARITKKLIERGNRIAELEASVTRWIDAANQLQSEIDAKDTRIAELEGHIEHGAGLILRYEKELGI